MRKPRLAPSSRAAFIPTAGRWGSAIAFGLALAARAWSQDLVDAHSGQVVSHDFGRTWIDTGSRRGIQAGNPEDPATLERRQRGGTELQEGINQLNAGNADLAMTSLWNALSDLPGDAAVKRWLGAAQNAKGLECCQRGQWGESLDYFGYASEQCPDDPAFKRNYRDAYEKFKQAQRARNNAASDQARHEDREALIRELSGAGPVQFPVSGPALMSAQREGEAAVDLADKAEADASPTPDFEKAAAATGRVFDTRGDWAGSLGPVRLHGLAPPPGIDYAAGPFREDPLIQDMLKDQGDALREKALCQLELEKVEHERITGGTQADSAASAAREDELKQRISSADNRAAGKAADLRRRATMIHFHVIPLSTGEDAQPGARKP